MAIRSRHKIAVLAAAGALVLSACSSGDSGDSGDSNDSTSTDGIAFGASKADYVKAFADVKPVKLFSQTNGAQGSVASIAQEEYAKAVTEWSDGKITFEFNFSSAVAPVGEEDDALADGRLDFAMTNPAQDPEKFAAFNEYTNASVLVDGGEPLAGPAAGLAFLHQLLYDIPDISSEFDKEGLHVLASAPMVPQVLYCNKKLQSASDLKGAVVSANSPGIARHLKAIGASPTSLSWAEVFEGLQRGAIDCGTSGLAIAQSTGMHEPAPNLMYPVGAAMGSGVGALAVSKSVWDELPLVARQLMHDRVDVYVTTWLRDAQYAANAATIDDVTNKYGGGMFALDDEVNAKLKAENDKTIDAWSDSDAFKDPAAVTKLAKDEIATWADTVNELGMNKGLTYAEFADWWTKNGTSLDLAPYTDKINSEILSKHRPS